LQKGKGILAREAELQQAKIEAAKQKVEQTMTKKFRWLI
jgi:hypothetical protein